MSAGETKEVTIQVGGMTCGHCVAHVKSALQKVPGVADAVVDLAKNSARVRFDAGATNVAALKQAIVGAGYEAAGASA